MTREELLTLAAKDLIVARHRWDVLAWAKVEWEAVVDRVLSQLKQELSHEENVEVSDEHLQR